MKLTDEVMNDLLTLYLAGEASADTNALVESHARQSPAFAAKVAAAGALPMGMPQDAPPNDLELRTLTDTRRFIFLRTLFLAGAILFTLMPLVFSFDERGIEFLVLGRHPELMWSFWAVAAAAWTACYVVQRQVRAVGL